MVSHLISSNIKMTVYSAQTKGDDHESLGATLIREAEKNKLSSTERSWVAGTMLSVMLHC
jgi:hypothetical protein